MDGGDGGGGWISGGRLGFLLDRYCSELTRGEYRVSCRHGTVSDRLPVCRPYSVLYTKLSQIITLGLSVHKNILFQLNYTSYIIHG